MRLSFPHGRAPDRLFHGSPGIYGKRCSNKHYFMIRIQYNLPCLMPLSTDKLQLPRVAPCTSHTGALLLPTP
jgi:hypothetical protein